MTTQNQDKPANQIRLLTCSVSEYALMEEVKISAYRPVEVINDNQDYVDTIEGLRSKAKELGCEAVVDLRSCYNHGYSRIYYSGTGLVRKTQEDESEIGEEQ
jgi:uncharacterized protein YbjQ (UPF0145 family)